MAAMDDSSLKRKEPEAEEPKAAATEGKQAAAADTSSTGAPDAKRLKPTPVEPKVVRKQVEYYLSDENLKYDKFFHDKISENCDGWLDMNLILTCAKMKAMRVTATDVTSALKESKIEVREDGLAVRRPGNVALPNLESKPQHPKKHAIHAHDGGVLAVFKDIPEGHSWQAVKDGLKSLLPEKACLWFVSEVSDKRECFVATAPFENDLKVFETVALDLGGSKINASICQGEILQQGLKVLPKHIREKREKEMRKRQKDKNKPIVVGQQKFINVGALRGRVKEILNSRTDGEALKPDGSDFKLIHALLQHHPKGQDKLKGLAGIKVDKSTQGEGKCFFMVKEDGTVDDFSAKKCLDALELNPAALAECKQAKVDVVPATAAVEPVKAAIDPAKPAETPAAAEAPKTDDVKAQESASEAKKVDA